MRSIKSFSDYILQDWTANNGRPQMQFMLGLFRASQFLRTAGPVGIALSKPVGLFYRSIALSLFSIDIPISTQIGRRFTIHHGMGLVIHNAAVIGRDVVVRQNVTIGSRRSGGGAPVVEDCVSFGAGSITLGDIRIGHGSQIGAGSVVVSPVPSGRAVVGNPARLLD